MKLWEGEARRHTPPAAALDRPALIDHLPRLLEDFADMIRTYDERPSLARAADAHADEHAWERIEQGFMLEHVVRELALLRSCILRLWRSEFPDVSVDDAEILSRVVERAVERSVSRYFEGRAQLMTAMEQIAEAAFDLEQFDDFLHGLLRIFMRFAPSMDSAVILLREGDHVTVRAAIGLEEEVRQRVTLRIGEGFAGTIAATRQPLLLHRASEGPLVKSQILRDRKTLALYGVPLCMGDDVVGVAHIGSCVSEDISEPEKRLFRALAQRATSAIVKHRLRERARRAGAELRGVLEALPSPVFVGDRTRLTNANAAGLRMLGFGDEAAMRDASLDEIRGGMQARDPQTGERVPNDETPFARALRGETCSREMVIRHPPDTTRIVRGDAGPIVVAGETVGAAIVFTDVTEQHRAFRELERSGEFRERFIGIVSHDLRNPLSAIAMAAGLLLKSPELAPALARPAGRILANVERMSKMISDLLDFTRGRLGGGIPIAPTPTELAHVARHVLEEFEQTHPMRRIELVRRGDTHGNWDGGRLAQVLTNLVGNALQHGDPDRPVRITLDGSAEDVSLVVANSGRPIPPDVLPHIFEPFRRGAEGASRSGLGLGLFICGEVTRAHGGKIHAESDAGGTRFVVVLPRRRDLGEAGAES